MLHINPLQYLYLLIFIILLSLFHSISSQMYSLFHPPPPPSAAVWSILQYTSSSTSLEPFFFFFFFGFFIQKIFNYWLFYTAGVPLNLLSKYRAAVYGYICTARDSWRDTAIQMTHCTVRVDYGHRQCHLGQLGRDRYTLGKRKNVQ